MIGISKNKKENRFGDINFLKNKVISFREKKGKSNWVNNGHYLFFKKDFDTVREKFFLRKNFDSKISYRKKT